jgi:hypothetical protein
MNDRSAALEPESRFDRSGRAALGWAILIITLILAQIVWRLRLPADGWTFPLDLTESGQRWVFERYMGREITSLRTGDQLLAIEGQPLSDIVGNAFRLQPDPPQAWRVGGTVTYTVLRDGERLEVPVTLARRTVGQYLRLLAMSLLDTPLNLLGLWLQSLIAIFIFIRKPGSRAAQVFLLWNVLILGNLLLMPLSGQNGAPAEMFSLAYWPTYFFNLLVYPFAIVPGLAHMFLVFPVVKAPMRRWPRLTTVLIYSLPAAISLPQIFSRLDAPLQIWPVLLNIGPRTIFPAAMLISLTSLLHTLTVDPSYMHRAQARWLLVGLILTWGIGNGALFFMLELGLIQPSPLLAVVNTPLLLAFPLTLAVTIFRYRLFNIDLIIRRTLIYGVLTGALALVYFGSVVLLQQLFQAVAGQNQSELATVISTLAIAALFIPLRQRVQDFIDRRFYRRKYDAAKTLASFSATVRDETDLDKLTERLVQVVDETMQPESVSLWLRKTEVKHKT